MSTTNCLLVLRNRKNNNFEQSERVINHFSKHGYYFEKISYVAYDNSSEIVTAVREGIEAYDNLVVVCPGTMGNTLKSFISETCAAQFNEYNIMKCGKVAAYLLFSESENNEEIETVCSEFDKMNGTSLNKAFIKTVGATVNVVNEAISSAICICGALTINVSESFGDCTIEIIFDDTVPKSLFDKAYRSMVSRLKEYIYALDDATLAERLVDLLRLRRMKLSVAESFTGGGIAKRLVEISGVSDVYVEGLNTYSNLSKSLRLGVKEETLEKYGAVSEETAKEMVAGLFKGGNCNVAVATTGIAGPKSDSTQKPVGLAYIAVGVCGEVKVYEYRFKGSRRQITETAVNIALFRIFKTLK